MDFSWSEEQQALYDRAAEFARESLSADLAQRDAEQRFDIDDWRRFVEEKLTGEGDWMSLARFEERLEKITGERDLDEQQYQLIHRLAEHAMDIRVRYEI